MSSVYSELFADRSSHISVCLPAGSELLPATANESETGVYPGLGGFFCCWIAIVIQQYSDKTIISHDKQISHTINLHKGATYFHIFHMWHNFTHDIKCEKLFFGTFKTWIIIFNMWTYFNLYGILVISLK